MGITINIHGHLRDAGEIPALAQEVADYADVLGWERWIVTVPPLTGVIIHPHEECETLALLFDESGILRNEVLLGEELDKYVAVKTQYAPLETHISLCNLLLHLKERYFAVLEVNDEGGYWETGDRSLLAARLTSVGDAIGQLGAALDKLPPPAPDATPEDLLRLVEETAAEVFDKDGDVHSVMLNRLNGPWPPFDSEELGTWDLQQWIDFWQRWDEHRSPCLAILRNRPETIETVRAALEFEAEIRTLRDADMDAVMHHLEEFGKRSIEGDEPSSFIDDEDIDDDEALLDEDDLEDGESWKKLHGAGDEESGSRSGHPTVFVAASRWYAKFSKTPGLPRDHPVVEYASIAIPPTVVGIGLAYDFRGEDGMFLAVPSRMLVCAQTLEHIARLFRLVPDGLLATLADEADALAREFYRGAE